MNPMLQPVDIFSSVYDWEESVRRSVPSLFWYRLVNKYDRRWPRC